MITKFGSAGPCRLNSAQDKEPELLAGGSGPSVTEAIALRPRDPGKHPGHYVSCILQFRSRHLNADPAPLRKLITLQGIRSRSGLEMRFGYGGSRVAR